MDLGTRISGWLKARGLTQQTLAKLVDVSEGAVSGWVNNEFSPSQASLLALVEALNLSMERFYGRVPKAKKTAKGVTKRAVA